MKREEFEELLPAYLAGDLPADTAARVEAYLAESADATEALEAYRVLENVLLERREQVPPVDRFVQPVFARSRVQQVRRILDTAFSFPALTSFALIVFGLVILVYRQPITAWVNQKASLPNSESLRFEWVGAAIAQAVGGDLWMLTGLYVAVTVLILLSTSLVLMRFLRN